MSAETLTRLSSVVAANVRAEAARRGWTQAEMCKRLGMAVPTMSDRYRERTPWTLDELDRLAELFGVDLVDLLARPKGFEPLTFWLGADHTLHVRSWNWNGPAQGFELFCDECGGRERRWVAPHKLATLHALRNHGESAERAA